MILRLRVWLLGFREGWQQWPDFGCGMTYPNPEHNEAYDRGVNAAQALRRVHP